MWGCRGVREENETLRQRLADVEVELQEQRALADRSRGLERLLELRGRTELQTTAAEVIASSVAPEFRTLTIDKGSQQGLRDRHGGHRPDGHRRPRRVADRARVQGAAADRPERRGRLPRRAIARPGGRHGTRGRTAADGIRRRDRGARRGRHRGHVGHRRDLSERVRHRPDRTHRQERRRIQGNPREAGRGFHDPRRGARRAHAHTRTRAGWPRALGESRRRRCRHRAGDRAPDDHGAVCHPRHGRRRPGARGGRLRRARGGAGHGPAGRDVRGDRAGRPVDRRHRHRRDGENGGRVLRRGHRDPVHRGPVAAAVRRIFRSDDRARRDIYRVVRAAEPG